MIRSSTRRTSARSLPGRDGARLTVLVLAVALSGCAQIGPAVGKVEPVVSGGASMALTCSNGRLEIQCDSTGCGAEDSASVTPMELTLDDSGAYSACAYSGCWEGRAEVLITGAHLILHATRAPFSSGDSEGDGDPLVVSVDLADDIAVLKVGPFAQPLKCRRVTPSLASLPGHGGR